MTEKGVIYILTSPSFPQYVKIGYASDLQRRLRELNRSEALPYAFRAYATYDVDHKLTDKVLHGLLDKLNPNLRTIETVNGKTRIREFFQMSEEDAYSILEAVARISGTEERLHRVEITGNQIIDEADEAEINEVETNEARCEMNENGKKRSRFRFSMIGLTAGDEIVFKNDESKRAIVVDDTHIEYEGVTTSMSKLAKKLLGWNSPAQGTAYFTYNGELLDDMRLQMEDETNGAEANEAETNEVEANEARCEINENGKKRSRFRFSMVGLKPGDEIIFKNDSSKCAIVVDDTHIEYEGVTTSMSKLAEKLLGRNSPVQGTICFTYAGELLSDMRLRMEGECGEIQEKEKLKE